MAKDWIKMRMDLPSHPKVVRILSGTKSDKFRVIGGLHAVWSVFDVHSVDGKLMGYTPETMDHIIGWDGFCIAMMNVGWLLFDGSETLAMPDFDTHNGQSAKKRAEESERKRRGREQEKRPQSVRKVSDKKPDKDRARVEERRVEDTKYKDNVASKDATSDYSSEFEDAWKAYPKRHTSSNKKETYKQWKARLRAGFTVEQMTEGVKRYYAFCKSEGQIGSKYVKLPATFFGPDEHFMEEWKVSKSETKSDPFSNSPTADQLAELKRNLGMR